MPTHDNTGVYACQANMSAEGGRKRGDLRTEMGKCAVYRDIVLEEFGKMYAAEKHLCTIEKSLRFWGAFLAVMLVDNGRSR